MTKLNLSVDWEKLQSLGFRKVKAGYVLERPLLDGALLLKAVVSAAGVLTTRVMDPATGEPYVLYLVAEATGAFVGQVRAEVETFTRQVYGCFVDSVFVSPTSQAVLAAVHKLYGHSLEFLWEKKDTAVLRNQDSKKWYGVFMKLSRQKLGFSEDRLVELIDLHGAPEQVAGLVDGKRYLPGYHMNKKYWYTIVLDGSVPAAQIMELIQASYALSVPPKRRRGS